MLIPLPTPSIKYTPRGWSVATSSTSTSLVANIRVQVGNSKHETGVKGDGIIPELQEGVMCVEYRRHFPSSYPSPMRTMYQWDRESHYAPLHRKSYSPFPSYAVDLMCYCHYQWSTIHRGRKHIFLSNYFLSFFIHDEIDDVRKIWIKCFTFVSIEIIMLLFKVWDWDVNPK